MHKMIIEMYHGCWYLWNTQTSLGWKSMALFMLSFFCCVIMWAVFLSLSHVSYCIQTLAVGFRFRIYHWMDWNFLPGSFFGLNYFVQCPWFLKILTWVLICRFWKLRERERYFFIHISTWILYLIQEKINYKKSKYLSIFLLSDKRYHTRWMFKGRDITKL